MLKDLGAKLREARGAEPAAKPAAASWREGPCAPFVAALEAFALTRALDSELVTLPASEIWALTVCVCVCVWETATCTQAAGIRHMTCGPS